MGRRVDIGDLLDVGGRIERTEEAGALQIGTHHSRDIPARLAVAEEFGDGERDRFGDALIDAHLQRGLRGPMRPNNGGQSEREGQTKMLPKAAKRDGCVSCHVLS